MKNILKVHDPNAYVEYVGAEKLHPLVGIVHYDELGGFRSSLNNYGVYGLFIQREFPKHLSYGMKTLEVSDASIIAVAPGQIGGAEDNGQNLTLSGWAILWSPELLHGTDLEERMSLYRFFSYFYTDSLRMEPGEWLRLTQLLTQLREELRENGDTPSLREIVLSYLRLILDYCNRIYLRQTKKEDNTGDDILKRFHSLLEKYYAEGRQMDEGIPGVKWCADALAYSAGYFGDMIRRATGGTAIGYIHSFVIDEGKSLLMKGYNVSETARLLGFDFPHHFTRLFKNVTGMTPSEFLGK